MYSGRQNFHPKMNPSWILILGASLITASDPEEEGSNENEEEGEDSSPENENQDDPNSTENQTRGGDIPSTFVDPARTGLVDPARTRSVDPART